MYLVVSSAKHANKRKRTFPLQRRFTGNNVMNLAFKFLAGLSVSDNLWKNAFQNIPWRKLKSFWTLSVSLKVIVDWFLTTFDFCGEMWKYLMTVVLSFCFPSNPEISAAGYSKDAERSSPVRTSGAWKTTHFHLKRRLQSMDLALMSFVTLSGLEIRHRGEHKGGVCRTANRPHEIDIQKSRFCRQYDFRCFT